MKFIHMADVHLGITPDVGKPWGEMRKQDIWKSFCEVIACAKKEQAELLLIAGDLFHRQPLKRELKEVAGLFADIPETEVVLIAGNHDYLHPKSYYRGFEWPDNVHMLLSDQVEGIYLDKLHTTVWGASYWKEMDERRLYDGAADLLWDNKSGERSEMSPQEQKMQGYHILLAHGGDEKHRPFRARSLAEAGFDYAALGHIHRAEQLIPGKVVMAGALEPTDCNDFGPHGYWIGQMDEAGVTVQFLPIKKCEYVKQEFVVNKTMTWQQILQGVLALLQEREVYQITHLHLLGYRDGDLAIDKDALLGLERVVKVIDDTIPDYPFDKLKEQYQGGLLGEFIDAMQKHPDQALAKEALYYGVWAMLDSM